MKSDLHNHWVLLATYPFPTEAHIAKSTLDAENIPALIENEHTVAANSLLSNAMGGVRLLVQEKDLEAAQSLITTDFSEEMERLYGADEPKSCPKCASQNLVAHVQGNKLGILSVLFLGLPFFRCKSGLRCTECDTFIPD